MTPDCPHHKTQPLYCSECISEEIHRHFPQSIINRVNFLGQQWEELYVKAYKYLQQAEARCNPLLPLSQYLDRQAGLKQIKLSHSLSKEMESFTNMIKTLEAKYRSIDKQSIMHLVMELCVLELNDLEPKRLEII